jgi:RNA polymerase sigma-70 factor (ECF subfamily)
MQHLDDHEVMARLRAGAPDALTVLFDRYHRLVYGIALRIVRDAGEAEDVTQTVFLDIYRAAAQFDPSKGSTKVWLLQYAYHRAISRKRYLNVRNFYDWAEVEAAAEVPLRAGSVASLSGADLSDLVRKGLASLNEPQRTVIEWASFEGLTLREIAEKRGETLVNVRHHYYRGLRKLRAFVERQTDVETAAADA